MTISVQPPPEWPQQSPDHPLDGPQLPSWVDTIPQDIRPYVAQIVQNGCVKFWDAAPVRALMERGMDGDDALALSYRLVSAALEMSALLTDLDAPIAAAA